MDALIKLAFEEDFGSDLELKRITDITTDACIPENMQASARVIAKQSGILSGIEVAKRVFTLINDSICCDVVINEGNNFNQNDLLMNISGSYRDILKGERTALNFLQRLSGVSTLTSQVVEKVSRYGVKILDTRKTTPGFRVLEKEAIRAGGGFNHRMGLYDQFLIKNNHIDALSGDIKQTIIKCRAYNPEVKLKIEVRDVDEIKAALEEVPDGLLLDNFTSMELTELVPWIRENSKTNAMILEASGGITIKNVDEYAQTGVDEISLGFLTHSVPSIDLSLRFDKIF